MAKVKNRRNLAPWYNPKHAKAQVNGQTQQTQDLIILECEARKRS